MKTDHSDVPSPCEVGMTVGMLQNVPFTFR